MNNTRMINLTDCGSHLCNRCFVELQDESPGGFDPNARNHRSVPWHPDDVCCCCHAAHPDKQLFSDVDPTESMGIDLFFGSARHRPVSVELARVNGFFRSC